MSGSASESRYDLFMSFHGSQKLCDLGFSWAGPNCTVRDLAKDASERLRSFERNPSVFYDHDEIWGRFRDDLSNAVLQLRGGGIALVLVSGKYWKQKYCLGELRAFLELEKLRNVPGRESEAIEICVVHLDSDPSSVRSAVADPLLKPFIGELGRFQFHQLTRSSTRALALQQICDPVFDYWRKKQSLCLGKEMHVSAGFLHSFFNTAGVTLIAKSFGIRDQEGMTTWSIFDQALRHGAMSVQNLNALFEATRDVYAKAAVRAFQRKWIPDGWSWNIEDSCENDICLTRSIEEAANVLGCRETASVTSTSAALAPADQTTTLLNSYELNAFRNDAYLLRTYEVLENQFKDFVAARGLPHGHRHIRAARHARKLA